MTYEKHLLFLTPLFPIDEHYSMSSPSFQVYVRELSLKYPQWRISIISLHQPLRSEPYKWHNVTVYPCQANFRSSYRKPPYWFKMFRYFQQIKRLQKIDCIHSFWLHDCALMGCYLSRYYDIPHYATAMGQDVRKQSRYLKVLPFQNIQKLILLSPFQNKILQEAINRQADFLIAWGMDVAQFPIPSQTQRDIDILGVGSLIQLKNYGCFIDLIAQLKKSFPSIKSCILGEGKERPFLEQKIKELNLEENVILKGLIPREEVMQLMNQSKILLHPSLYESQAYVFYEALHSGMHIVSYEVGVAKEGEKWRVAQNESELLNYLQFFLNHPVDYQSRQVLTVDDTIKAYVEKVYDF